MRAMLKRKPNGNIADNEQWKEISEYVDKMVTDFANHFDTVAIDDLHLVLICTGGYALSKAQIKYAKYASEEL